MADLQTELLLLIFTYLSPKERCAVAPVHSKWTEVGSVLTLYLGANTYSFLPCLLRNTRRTIQMRTLMIILTSFAWLTLHDA